MTLLASPGIARLIVGYAAIACALPYLALKIVWLTGGQIGVADPEMMRDGSMVALNAVTAGMDLVAIAIALAFTHRWGERIPAWLVLPPVWVATGLLAKFVAGVPVVFIASTLASDAARRPPAGPVHAWVYAVVYTGFAGMGIGLMVAFLLYSRTRWPWVFQSKTVAVEPGATHAVQVPLAHAAALMATAVAALHLAWAFGVAIGLTADQVSRRTTASHLIDAIDAAMTIAAAAGVLMMVHRLGRRWPFWAPLALTWVGGASLFAWGLWHLINVLSQTALIRDQVGDMALLNLVSLVRLITGLVIGLLTLFLLAERSANANARVHVSVMR